MIISVGSRLRSRLPMLWCGFFYAGGGSLGSTVSLGRLASQSTHAVPKGLKRGLKIENSTPFPDLPQKRHTGSFLVFVSIFYCLLPLTAQFRIASETSGSLTLTAIFSELQNSEIAGYQGLQPSPTAASSEGVF